ncbi:hypothetical protein AB1Y20_018279 [Prymnesium parvum]|uniref:Uncharacterized protein n=1 Tax=Prymnesium parvum TaxID=97485 RepID=A0AB34JQD5_PRYPA
MSSLATASFAIAHHTIACLTFTSPVTTDASPPMPHHCCLTSAFFTTSLTTAPFASACALTAAYFTAASAGTADVAPPHSPSPQLLAAPPSSPPPRPAPSPLLSCRPHHGLPHHRFIHHHRRSVVTTAVTASTLLVSPPLPYSWSAMTCTLPATAHVNSHAHFPHQRLLVIDYTTTHHQQLRYCHPSQLMIVSLCP